jgi:hypothetical protein
MHGDPNYWVNNNNPFQNNWVPRQPTPNWGAPQLQTNKIPVTSLEEALSKPAERYSEMYYWDQSKPVIYVVRTDQNMVKSWAVIPYTLPDQEQNAPVTRADLAALEARIADLEAAKPKKSKPKVEQEAQDGPVE